MKSGTAKAPRARLILTMIAGLAVLIAIPFIAIAMFTNNRSR